MIGYHRPTITEIEAGRRKTTAEELQLFAKTYDISVAWLMNESAVDPAGDAKLRVAARELAKMKPQDVDRLMEVLKMLKGSEG